MNKRDPLLLRRIIMAAAGILLTGISIGFFKRSLFGVDPYQCFINGLDNCFPLRYSTVYLLMNLLQLIVVFFLNRRYIGISTLMNLFLLGYVVEYSEAALALIFGELGLAARVVFLIVGIVVTCIAAALYYSADLGVSTYDAIPLHIASRQPKLFGHVLPFRAVRIISDVICTAIGVALGARAGVGTVITALFMGPLISFFRHTISDPLVQRK